MEKLGDNKQDFDKYFDNDNQEAFNIETPYDGLLRPEFNIAKYATIIFDHPHSPDLDKPKKHEWTDKKTGENHKITITPLYGGTRPVFSTYKTLVALTKIWDEQGRNQKGVVNFTSRRIAEISKTPTSGQNFTKIENDIDVMQGAQIVWEHSFKTDYDGEVNKKKITMHLLGDGTRYLKMKDRKKSETFTGRHNVYFGSHMLDNLVKGVTKPIVEADFFDFNDPNVFGLYIKLDTYLTGTTTRLEYKAQTILAHCHNIKSEKYHQRRFRKAKLLEFVKALHGRRISQGEIVATIEETVDKSDWKICFSRINIPQKQSAKNTPKTKAIANEIIELLNKVKCNFKIPTDKATIQKLAATYPQDWLFEALGQIKSKKNINYAGPAFVDEIHRIAHREGRDWIIECGEECRYRSKQ